MNYAHTNHILQLKHNYRLKIDRNGPQTVEVSIWALINMGSSCSGLITSLAKAATAMVMTDPTPSRARWKTEGGRPQSGRRGQHRGLECTDGQLSSRRETMEDILHQSWAVEAMGRQWWTWMGECCGEGRRRPGRGGQGGVWRFAMRGRTGDPPPCDRGGWK